MTRWRERGSGDLLARPSVLRAVEDMKMPTSTDNCAELIQLWETWTLSQTLKEVGYRKVLQVPSQKKTLNILLGPE